MWDCITRNERNYRFFSILRIYTITRESETNGYNSVKFVFAFRFISWKVGKIMCTLFKCVYMLMTTHRQLKFVARYVDEIYGVTSFEFPSVLFLPFSLSSRVVSMKDDGDIVMFISSTFNTTLNTTAKNYNEVFSCLRFFLALREKIIFKINKTVESNVEENPRRFSQSMNFLSFFLVFSYSILLKCVFSVCSSAKHRFCLSMNFSFK